ncbi:hypothetical protein JCGZ_15290 [Jatropha curcas]|uniref:Uncharacterized protein n=1 Tax=Jatropha curcas TaxID=180498 RepID=A0A067LBJ1_JATCU|nr:hypothetical protein JCGZ_15290 [Jatropha curcas]
MAGLAGTGINSRCHHCRRSKGGEQHLNRAAAAAGDEGEDEGETAFARGASVPGKSRNRRLDAIPVATPPATATDIRDERKEARLTLRRGRSLLRRGNDGEELRWAEQERRRGEGAEKNARRR